MPWLLISALLDLDLARNALLSGEFSNHYHIPKTHIFVRVPSFLRASLDEKLDPPAGETRVGNVPSADVRICSEKYF